MDNSYYIGSKERTDPPYSSNPPPSKLKTYGFAIAIIIGIGGLGALGVGVAGYLGTISNLNQIHAIIIMAAGGGGGTILFIVGVVGTVKNVLENNNGNRTHQPIQVSRLEIIRTTDTQGGLVYGSDAWRILGVEVVDKVPPAPKVSWDEDDPYFKAPYRDNYFFLYIPKKIKVGGEKKDLTLQTLEEINRDSFSYFSEDVKEEVNNRISPGWVLMSKNVIPDSQNKSYRSQKMFSMPHALEAIAANLMIFAFTRESLYGDLLYTRCLEEVKKTSEEVKKTSRPVVVGGRWGYTSLCEVSTSDVISNKYGVAPVFRKL